MGRASHKVHACMHAVIGSGLTWTASTRRLGSHGVVPPPGPRKSEASKYEAKFSGISLASTAVYSDGIGPT